MQSSSIHDAGHCLVAVLSSLEFRAGEYDVGGKELGVCHEGGIVLVDLERAYKLLLLGLDDLDHSRFGAVAFAGGRHHDAHFVAIERMHRVALGHHDHLVVDHDCVLAVAAAHEEAYILDSPVALGLVFAQINLKDVVRLHKLVECVEHIETVRRILDADPERDLFVIEALPVLLLQKPDYLVKQLLLAHTSACCILFLHRNWVISY